MTPSSSRLNSSLLVGFMLSVGVVIGMLLAAYIAYAFVPAGWILRDAPPSLLKFDPTSESVQYRDLYISRVANRFKRLENNPEEGLREALFALGVTSGDVTLEEAIGMVRAAELAASKENSRPEELAQPDAGFFTAADQLNLKLLLDNLEQLQSNPRLLQALQGAPQPDAPQTLRSALRQPVFVLLFIVMAMSVLLIAVLLLQNLLESALRQRMSNAGSTAYRTSVAARAARVVGSDTPTTVYAEPPSTSFGGTAGQAVRAAPTHAYAPQATAEGVSLKGAPFQTFSAKYAEDTLEFDESKDLYAPSGEMLGECGVSIAERYGLGASSRPIAFVVWVFDKADMGSETRILLTPFASANPSIRRRLEARGTLIEMQSDQMQFEIVTSTMRVEVRVSNIEFRRIDATPMDSVQQAEFHFSAFLKQPA